MALIPKSIRTYVLSAEKTSFQIALSKIFQSWYKRHAKSKTRAWTKLSKILQNGIVVCTNRLERGTDHVNVRHDHNY